MNLPPAAQDAINQGADPIQVQKRFLDIQGQEAIAAGADPKAVEARTVEIIGGMVPQKDAPQPEPSMMDKVKSGAASAAGGALLGLGKGVTNVAQAGLDLAEAGGVPNAGEMSQQLGNRMDRASQQFQNLPSQQETPTAGKVGEAVGELALPTAAAAATGGGLGAAVGMGAAVGFTDDVGQTDTPIKDRLTNAAIGAGTMGAISAVGSGIKAVAKFAQSPGMQRFLTKIPLIGNKGKELKQGMKINKEVQDVLTKHGYLNNKPIQEVEQSTWTNLYNKVGQKKVLPNRTADTKLNAAFDKLNSSNLSDSKSAADKLMQFKLEINSKGTFEELHKLKQTINQSVYNDKGFLVGGDLKAKISKAATENIDAKLKGIAGKSAKEFEAGNFLTQKRVLAEKAQSVLDQAKEGRKTLDLDWFSRTMKKELANDKSIHSGLAKQYGKEVDSVRKLITDNKLASEVFKSSDKLSSLTTLLTATAAGGAAATAGYYTGMGAGTTTGLVGAGIGIMTILSRNPAAMSAVARTYTNKGAKAAAVILNDIIRDNPPEQEQR